MTDAAELVKLADELNEAFERCLHGDPAKQEEHSDAMREVLWDNKAGIIAYLRLAAQQDGDREADMMPVWIQDGKDFKEGWVPRPTVQHIGWLKQYAEAMDETNWKDMRDRMRQQLAELTKHVSRDEQQQEKN